MMVIVSGAMDVEVDGKAISRLREGKFVGEMSFVTGQPPSADVVATAETRYVWWPRGELQKFLAGNPALRAAMQLVIGTDLAAKLRAA